MVLGQRTSILPPSPHNDPAPPLLTPALHYKGYLTAIFISVLSNPW